MSMLSPRSNRFRKPDLDVVADERLPPIRPVLSLAASESVRPSSAFVFLAALARRKWTIALFTIVSTAATYLVSTRLTPVYEATTTLDVDRQAAPGIIGLDAKRPDVDSDYDQFLATQVKLIQSDAVLRPVATQFGLQTKEGQITIGRGNAPITLRNLHVTRPPNTFLLQISYRSSDPELAADAANAIANSYILQMFQSRVEASAKLSSFMGKQLQDLKNTMDKSGIALTTFEREMDLISPEEKINILAARLMQVNAESTNAQTDRLKKQAAYDSVRTNTIEAAVTSSQGEVLKRLLDKEGEAQQRFIQIKAHYGSEHPEYRKGAADVQEIQRQIEATKESLIKRTEVEYRESVAREQMLQHAVIAIKSEYNELNSKSFSYQQLKREAEADKKLYEELTRRIRESNINSNFDNNAIRLADVARPPAEPVSPRIKQNVLFAFLFSSLLACGVVLIFDGRNTTIQRATQVTQCANTNVIGILPAVRAWISAGYSPPGNLVPGPGELATRWYRKSEHSLLAFDESVRTLRNSILLGSRDRRIQTILVTSASTGEGKSTTALHLAFVHAAHGLRTLLIDADLRRPSLQTMLNLPADTPGLADALVQDMGYNTLLVDVENHPDLHFLPAGNPSRRASDLVGQRIEAILRDLAPDYDLIVIDGPPFLGIAESLLLANSADAVVVVARAGKTDLPSLELVLNNLTQLRAHVAGVVLNCAPASLGEIHGTYRCG